MSDTNEQFNKSGETYRVALDVLNKQTEEADNNLKDKNRELKEVLRQLSSAESDLSILKLEVKSESDKLVKVKGDYKDAFKIEGDKLVQAQQEVQKAKDDLALFLAETAKERKNFEETKELLLKENDKLDEKKKTLQAMIDEKKGYVADAKRRTEELNSAASKAEAEQNSMKVLETKLVDKDTSLKLQESGIKNREIRVNGWNDELNRKDKQLSAFEASLVQRETKVKEEEEKVNLIKLANDEKETQLIKYEESLKLKGYTPPVEPKADEPKVEESKPEVKKPKKESKKGRKKGK